MNVILLDGKPSERQRDLRRLYDEDESLRREADAIHERRLLPPPTCYGCIELALEKRATTE